MFATTPILLKSYLISTQPYYCYAIYLILSLLYPATLCYLPYLISTLPCYSYAIYLILSLHYPATPILFTLSYIESQTNLWNSYLPYLISTLSFCYSYAIYLILSLLYPAPAMPFALSTLLFS